MPHRQFRFVLLAGLAGAMLIALVGMGPGNQNQPGAVEPGVDWSQVREVLVQNCLECHGGEKRESDLSFADGASFAQGGSRGDPIDHDQLDNSRLLQVIGYADPNLAMPPSGKLPTEAHEILASWVRAGAHWPEGPQGRLADPAKHPQHKRGMDFDSDWWSYQPLSVVEVPEVDDTDWNTHAIDALIHSHLAKRDLEPAGEASPEQLLRRASFDLIGLPPSPEQISAFTRAYRESPESAWAAVIDELLSSPEYGEHWARFWLDQVRYAQTNGYERDGTKPNIWRYRDWVIRAFNSDMPYDEFLTQQIAGDELLQVAPESYTDESPIIATGFYRLGVWDDEPADPLQARADELADIVDTTGQVVLGMTMGCARCHDHKADPISQKDYYAFTAFFNNITSYGNNNGNTRKAESVRMIADSNRAGHISRAEADQRIAELRSLIDQQVAGVEWETAESEPVVQDARDGGSSWRYLIGDFPQDAHLQAFDDSGWELGQGGFGTRGTPGAIIGTNWSTRKITIRQDFLLSSIPESLILSIHHDERARVFLNGRMVTDLSGYTTGYREIQLDHEALRSLVVGSNTIAIMCEQTNGGQYIDAGLRTGWLDTPEALVLRVESESKRNDAAEEVRAAGQLAHEIREVERTPINEPYAALVIEERGNEAPAQHVLMRGSAHALGDEVEPMTPQVLAWAGFPELPESGQISGSTGRRLALAQWMVDDAQSITARVMANKMWQSHFGRGLARSSGDFGKLGQQPTHPQLLDYLAQRLIDHNWSLKDMHREIMMTRAYRMETSPGDRALEVDPLNDLYQHADPRRLTAEQYRDAVLEVSGQLNDAMYGPAVYPKMAEEVLATSSRPDAAWGQSSGEDASRRSIYVFAKRSLRLPLLESLDQPSPDLPCLNRFSTNVPTQALITLNGEFVNESADRFAKRLLAETDSTAEAIDRGIQLAFARDAHGDEVERYMAFIERMRREHDLDEQEGLQLFCLILFNTNEFMWLD